MTKLFFIVGCGRSGTTMLQQALNRHSQIAIPPETRFFAFLKFGKNSQRQHLHRLAWDLAIDLPLPRSRVCQVQEARNLYQQIAALYLQRLGRPQVTCFGDKTPENLLYIGDVRCHFPEAKIILIYRDGRDVALSLTKVPWTHSDLYVNFAIWLYYYRIHKKVIKSKMENVYTVKYEDLVARPELELEGVLKFLGLPNEPQVANDYGNVEGVPAWEHGWKAGALQRINTSRVGVWRRELLPDQIATLERWGGDALRALDYELSTSGEGRLPLFFFPRLLWKIAVWRAGKALRAIQSELWEDEFAEVEDCKRKLAHGENP